MPSPALLTARTFLAVLMRELRGYSRSRLLWGLTVFATVLALILARLGTQEFDDRLAAHAALAAETERQASQPDLQLTGWRVEPALRAVRPPEPLSTVVAGFDAVLPDFWDFGPAGRRTGHQYSRRADLESRMDLESVVRIVLGLLAFVLVLDGLAAERWNGTLLALFAQPVRPGVVFAAKTAAGAAALSLSALAVLGAALLGVGLAEPRLITAGLLGTLAVFGLGSCLYLLAHFAMGVAVSVALSPYRLALWAALIIWLFGSVLALPVAQMIAASLSPTPSASVIEAESDRIVREWTERAEVAIGDEYLKAVPAGVHWSRADMDPVWVSNTLQRLEAVWERHSAALAQALDGLRSRATAATARQRCILKWLALVSPGGAFHASSANLAGTGEVLVRTWESATMDYETALNRQLFRNRPRLTGRIQTDDDGRTGWWVVGINRRPFPTLDAVPMFHAPSRAALRERVGTALPHLAALALYALGLIGAGWFTFGRMRF